MTAPAFMPLSMPVDAMKFRILGPFEAIGPGGQALPCSGRPLKLLALLLVDGSHAVPADVAIEALWGDALPAAQRPGRGVGRAARRRLRAAPRRARLRSTVAAAGRLGR
jgi:hypothetical protein